MTPLQQLTSAASQLLAILLFCFGAYHLHRLIFRNSDRPRSFREYIGLRLPQNLLDRDFWLMAAGLAAFGAISTALQLRLSDSLREIILGDSSPYGKILKAGFGPQAVLSGLIYCFIQASASEELLFRG